MGTIISIELYRESSVKFDSRTLNRETLGRWTGRRWTGRSSMYVCMYVCFFFDSESLPLGCGCSGGEGTPPETLKCLTPNPCS